MTAEHDTVTLKDFVRDAIIDVIKGVSEAQDQLLEIGGGPLGNTAQVNPPLAKVGSHIAPSSSFEGIDPKHNARFEVFEFDVAVTATQGEGERAGVGVMLAAIGVGAQTQSSQEDRSISRIKFSVPVVLPS